MPEEKSSAQEELETLLRDGKITEEEFNDLWKSLHAEGARTHPQPAAKHGFREWFKHEAARNGISMKELALLFFLALVQIFGLIAVIAGIPIVPAISGFATILYYYLMPKNNPFLNKLCGIAALCGLFEIIFSILTAL